MRPVEPASLTRDLSCRTISNMKTTLTVRNQISIPKTLCDRLDLKPGTRIDWEISGEKLVGRPLSEHAWTKLIGLRKDGPGLVTRLLKTRGEDRARETRKLAG